MKGYDKKKLKFIPNGYDLSIYKIDEKKKKFKKVRHQDKFPIIGYVARYDPQRSYEFD